MKIEFLGIKVTDEETGVVTMETAPYVERGVSIERVLDFQEGLVGAMQTRIAQSRKRLADKARD